MGIEYQREQVMELWEMIQEKLLSRQLGSEPRDIFESIVEDYEERIRELKKQRLDLKFQFRELLEEANSLVYSTKHYISKHLAEECQKAEKLLEELDVNSD